MENILTWRLIYMYSLVPDVINICNEKECSFFGNFTLHHYFLFSFSAYQYFFFFSQNVRHKTPNCNPFFPSLSNSFFHYAYFHTVAPPRQQRFLPSIPHPPMIWPTVTATISCPWTFPPLLTEPLPTGYFSPVPWKVMEMRNIDT